MGEPRVVFEDRRLPHQVRLSYAGRNKLIAVGCNCLGRGCLAARPRWAKVSDFMDIYRAHLPRPAPAPDPESELCAVS
jgi:hypothetical protein